MSAQKGKSKKNMKKCDECDDYYDMEKYPFGGPQLSDGNYCYKCEQQIINGRLYDNFCEKLDSGFY